GDNNYTISRAVKELVANFNGQADKVDGADIDLNRLADLLAGGGLFNEKKLVIITELSKNKTIWPLLPDWLNRVDTDTELILIEPKLDKRTATYKTLKTKANIQEFINWTEREQVAA